MLNSDKYLTIIEVFVIQYAEILMTCFYAIFLS